VYTTNGGKKRKKFVIRDFNAAMNTRRCAVLKTRPAEMMRANSVGEPRKVELYAEKSKPVAGGQSKNAGMHLRIDIHLPCTLVKTFCQFARALVHGYTLMRADAITLAMRL